MAIFIEKVEIKHFRCFDGGVRQPNVELVDLQDVNIISGANDSGKSNILRALNLFFNNEILPGVPFNLERDLCKLKRQRSDERVAKKRKEGVKDVRQRDLWVKIKLHFYNPKKGILPEHFYVEKMWDHAKEGIISASNHKNKKLRKTQQGAADGQLTQFLKQFRFEYVPAIKDREYFRYLFGKLQEALFEKDSSAKFKTHSEKFNELLLKETTKLFEDFKNDTNIEAKFEIPSTLVDFVRTLSVTTENNISLFERGDGIQARFIPEILNELYRGQKKKKIIWGFEEPENSYEDKNLRKLRDDFVNVYANSKQIFLTTHSFNILSLEATNIAKYRVWKTNGISLINKITDGKNKLELEQTEKERLEEELGIFEISQELERTYQEIIKKRELISIKLSELERQIERTKTPIIFLEGRTDEMYLNKAKELFGSATNKYIFQWVGHLKSNGEEEFTGETALDKLKSFILGNDNCFPHKSVLLYDCDTNKQETISDKLIIKTITRKNNNVYKKGIENSLSFPDNFDYNKYYSNKEKIGDYGEKKIIQEFEKMRLAQDICENFSEDNQRIILSGLGDIIHEIEQLLFGTIND